MVNVTERQFEVFAHDLVISVEELWWRCFALGTMHTARELEAFLRGTARPTRYEYNVIAVALNEYFVDIGLPRAIPYLEECGDVEAGWARAIPTVSPPPES